MIIGGAELYAQLFPRASRLYLTIINRDFEGDTYFPDYDRSEWSEVLSESVDASEDSPHPYRFVILERSNGD